MTISPPGGASSQVTFSLDALDRHATRLVNAVNTDTYAYLDATETTWTTGTTGSPTTSLLDVDGSRLAIKTGSAVNWLVFDLHGSVAALCPAASSTLAEAYRYDGAGQLLTGSGTAVNPYRFRGLLNIGGDATTGALLDMAARDYSPQLGTFTQLDSVQGGAANPLSMNRFLYALANPATLVDPDGHRPMGGCDPDCDPTADDIKQWQDNQQAAARHESQASADCDRGCDRGADDPADYPDNSTTNVILFNNGVFNPATTACATSMDAATERSCAKELLRLSGRYLMSSGCASIEVDCQVLDEEIELLIQQATANGTTLAQEIEERERRWRDAAFARFIAPYVTGVALGVAGVASSSAWMDGLKASELERVGTALSKEDAYHRAVSWVVDDPAAQGFSVVGPNGTNQVLYQLPGEINGRPGVFEWIIDSTGPTPVITHQFFIEGGRVTGLPLQYP